MCFVFVSGYLFVARDCGRHCLDERLLLWQPAAVLCLTMDIYFVIDLLRAG